MSVLLASIPLWAALLPVGGYLACLGWLHLRCRPIVVPGAWDLTLLATAVSGLVLAGPLALLQPAVGAAPWTAVMLILAFVLVVAAGILATRPRLVVYNITAEQFRPILAEVVGGLDGTARWAGESVVLPARGIQLLVDGHGLALAAAGLGIVLTAVGWAVVSRPPTPDPAALVIPRQPFSSAPVPEPRHAGPPRSFTA